MALPLQERYINLLTDFDFKRVFGTESMSRLSRCRRRFLSNYLRGRRLLIFLLLNRTVMKKASNTIET